MKNRSVTYNLDTAEDMIDLAKDIQIRVYWGGTYHFDEFDIPWKDFWDHLSDERVNHGITRVEMEEDTIRFIKGDKSHE